MQESQITLFGRYDSGKDRNLKNRKIRKIRVPEFLEIRTICCVNLEHGIHVFQKPRNGHLGFSIQFNEPKQLATLFLFSKSPFHHTPFRLPALHQPTTWRSVDPFFTTTRKNVMSKSSIHIFLSMLHCLVRPFDFAKSTNYNCHDFQGSCNVSPLFVTPIHLLFVRAPPVGCRGGSRYVESAGDSLT